MKRILTLCAALALSACAAFDAAHIEGQKQDAAKYKQYSDVELAKQEAVSQCFARATTDNQLATCAMLGMATGMASTFGGRPTGTTLAPTTAQVIKDTAKAVAPVWGAVELGRSVSGVQAKDPIVVQQPAPVIVEPTIIEVPALAP